MTDREMHTVTYGRSRIEYRLRRSDTRRLSISVSPDGSVDVLAPLSATGEEIAARVRRRGRWIRSQQADLAELRRLRLPKRYVSGETHRYLGRQYRLKVRQGESSVKLKGGYYEVAVPDRTDSGEVRKRLETWYRERGRVVFGKLLDDYLARKVFAGIPEPRLTIRRMKTRWGSCTSDGHILLNLTLIQAPKDCIEYVLVHELCHLIHHNHGKEFYRLLDQILPDWKNRRKRLNRCEL